MPYAGCDQMTTALDYPKFGSTQKRWPGVQWLGCCGVDSTVLVHPGIASVVHTSCTICCLVSLLDAGL